MLMSLRRLTLSPATTGVRRSRPWRPALLRVMCTVWAPCGRDGVLPYGRSRSDSASASGRASSDAAKENSWPDCDFIGETIDDAGGACQSSAGKKGYRWPSPWAHDPPDYAALHPGYE